MKKPKYRIADEVRLSTFTKGYHYCVPEKHEDYKGPGLLASVQTIKDIYIAHDGDIWYTFMGYNNWVTEDAIEGSVPNFVVGKWYTCEGMYGKLTSYPESPKFPSTEWIDEKGQYHDTGTFFLWTQLANIEEADMSEVSKHLPYGHPDKMQSKYPKYARYVKSGLNHASKGDIFAVNTNGRMMYDVGEKDYYLYNSTEFEPATEEEYLVYQYKSALKSPTTPEKVKIHDDLPTSISLSRMYESIYGKDSQTTSPKTKNEHVIHQSPVLIGKKKPFKQLFIINN